jgi:hypothetical protein
MEIEQRIEQIESRLDRIEKNLDLCVNYCREVARVHLSAETIVRIEAELGNGHDSEPTGR